MMGAAVFSRKVGWTSCFGRYFLEVCWFTDLRVSVASERGVRTRLGSRFGLVDRWGPEMNGVLLLWMWSGNLAEGPFLGNGCQTSLSLVPGLCSQAILVQTQAPFLLLFSSCVTWNKLFSSPPAPRSYLEHKGNNEITSQNLTGIVHAELSGSIQQALSKDCSAAAGENHSLVSVSSSKNGDSCLRTA